MKKLIIIGAGETAQMAFEYLASLHTVSCFSVERAHLTKNELLGTPIVPLEELKTFYPSETHEAFIAVSYTGLNQLRKRLFEQVKSMGYNCISYIHPSAQLGNNVKIGENCFILEACVLQRNVNIGDNVTIWSGSVIAHQSVIYSHAFVACNCTISGFCEIGAKSFIGAGVITNDFIKISENNLIGSGAVVTKNTEKNSVYIGNPAKKTHKNPEDLL